jgi:uncharacterized protein (UPF0210 family)
MPAVNDLAASRPAARFRVRTVTAGIALDRLENIGAVEAALDAVSRVRGGLTADGYEVQTVRVATPPLLAGLAPAERSRALTAVQALDRLVAGRGALLSLGPASRLDADETSLASWIAGIVGATSATFTSIVVADPVNGILRRAARSAARVIAALAHTTAAGSGNFRFAAAANIPAGTPFFPVAWHDGRDSLAVGLETADIVREALDGAPDSEDARHRLRKALAAAFEPVDRVMRALAGREGREWKGLDTSPAPLGDISIGAAIEARTGRPFGDPGTLDACALVTAALRDQPFPLCGYCGLMLPVLEDLVLAKRVVEGRYGLRDLLLYSSVCGTGLDLVPLPGETPIEVLAGVITDVAALSDRLRKPLSARLYLVPGRAAGEPAQFDDPYLTDAVVMAPER